MARLASQQFQTSSFSVPSSPLLSTTSSRVSKGAVSSVRFVQLTGNSDPKQPASTKFDKMADKTITNPNEKPLNVMEEAFGEGYATRSDEEGFGGIYGGNDETNAEQNIIHDPLHHDSSQGSHVEEKEKARNQTDAH